jgi:hypothetical protein
MNWVTGSKTKTESHLPQLPTNRSVHGESADVWLFQYKWVRELRETRAYGPLQLMENYEGWKMEMKKGKRYIFSELFFNSAPRHERVLGEWRYSPLILRPRH